MSFLALSGREKGLVQTFWKFCVQLGIIHPFVHMTRTFVIQGCPTLMPIAYPNLEPLLCLHHALQWLHCHKHLRKSASTIKRACLGM